MRKSICSLVVAIVLMFVIIWVAERIVVREGYVESVEEEIVTIVTNCGSVWEWSEENASYTAGDKVRLVMDNAGTERVIEDDTIRMIIKIDK